MASREGQGMQIAVILFAILTVILAVTTYIYYAAAETKEKERAAAQEATKTATAAQNKANFEAAALKFMLGFAKQEDVDAARNKVVGAENAEVANWLAQFDRDMAMFGNAGADTLRNYTTLPQYLVTSIGQKNARTLIADALTQKERDDRKVEVDTQIAAKVTAETGLKATVDSTAEARQTFQAELKLAQDTGAAAQKQAAETMDKAKKADEKSKADYDALAAVKGNIEKTKDSLVEKVNSLQSEQGVNIDNPDATIIWVNQKQRLVWIDRGYDDGLGRQMSFAVYSQTQASLFTHKSQMRKEGTGMEKVKKLASKGRIEVVRVTGAHQAECRILDDKVADPILPGDWIHSPAWSPGQRLHFALVGFMDIDGDQQSDRETIKHIITMNGGVIDTEIKDDGERDEGKMSVNTRYVVLGSSSEKGNVAIKNLAQYQTTRIQFFNDVDLYGVEKISVQQLLDMMGWKPEEKTIGLGGVMDAGFSKRGPGAKAAPAKAPAGEAPAAEAPAAEPPPAEAAPKGPAKKKAGEADDKDPFGGK